MVSDSLGLFMQVGRRVSWSFCCCKLLYHTGERVWCNVLGDLFILCMYHMDLSQEVLREDCPNFCVIFLLKKMYQVDCKRSVCQKYCEKCKVLGRSNMYTYIIDLYCLSIFHSFILQNAFKDRVLYKENRQWRQWRKCTRCRCRSITQERMCWVIYLYVSNGLQTKYVPKIL